MLSINCTPFFFFTKVRTDKVIAVCRIILSFLIVITNQKCVCYHDLQASVCCIMILLLLLLCQALRLILTRKVKNLTKQCCTQDVFLYIYIYRNKIRHNITGLTGKSDIKTHLSSSSPKKSVPNQLHYIC